MNGIKKNTTQRIQIIDALRGFSVVLMVAHHFLYDIVTFIDVPEYLFHNTVFDILQQVFASVFIVLSGISSNFSKSNLKRGLFTLVVAVVVSLVTLAVDMPIIFGILHLLSVCMIFYGITQKFWKKIPQAFLLVLFITLSVVAEVMTTKMSFYSDNLWIFGFPNKDFVSYDYFPLLPWFFVFMTGTCIGYYIKQKKFPNWFYTAKIPVFPAIGKHSLIIYIAHQPVLFLITMLIQAIVL